MHSGALCDVVFLRLAFEFEKNGCIVCVMPWRRWRHARALFLLYDEQDDLKMKDLLNVNTLA
jgi:hypothetical protein